MSDQCQIVVFASQKGGSGKTTLAGHVAVQADLAGAGPVALIDTDPQGSLARWWNAREAETPSFAQATLPTLARDIEVLRNGGARLIVIDTPPAITSSIVEVVTHADMVVIPTRPSPHDLRAVGATVDIAEHQNKPLVFVVNSATMRARITTDVAVALSQHGTVAPSVIHHRVDFAASMIDGRTVCETNAESRSAKEISGLWDYLSERLARLKPAVNIQRVVPQHVPPAEILPDPVVTPIDESIVHYADDEIPYQMDDVLPEPKLATQSEPSPALSAGAEEIDDDMWREPVLQTGHVDMRLGFARFGSRVRTQEEPAKRKEG